MVSAEAYAPGHITAFFQADTNSPNVYKKGSKGVGICTKKGATAETIILPARNQKIDITINGREESAEITRYALKALLKDSKYKVKVNIKTELPISQGCGMSAAGTLASAMAVSSCLGLNYSDALMASHKAEVELGGGLGDIMGETIGGITILWESGIFPYAKFDKLLFGGDIVLCVLGEPIKTSSVLSSKSMRSLINRWGSYAMDEFSKKQSIERLFELGRIFATKIRMVDKHIDEAIKVVWDNGGMASVAMLGRIVFAYGKTSKIVDLLDPYGEVYVTKISQQGAYLSRVPA